MYTQTTKQILAPVADAVSQLLVVKADAEINNTPMQDLTEVATVVDAQAQNLVGIGKSMAESSDDAQLKQEMPSACDESMLRICQARELITGWW